MATTCSECDAVIGDADVAPCAECGSTARTHHLHVDDALHSHVVDAAYISGIGYGPTEWTQQWLVLLHHLAEVRRLYVDWQADNQQLTREIDAFFVACLHMLDWLENDHSSAAHITETDLRKYTDNDPALKICNAYANTRKHKELRKPERLQAKTSEFRCNPATGCSMEIAYESSVDSRQTVDALDLAEQCVAAWRTYIIDKGLAPPA